MKSLIIYKSIHHANTKKVALVLAEDLKADLVEVEKAEKYNFSEYDLIGFGSGIYMWRHHALIFKLINSLPKIEKKAFIFSTSGVSGKIILDLHKILRKKLKSKGFKIIGEFNCLGWDTFSFLKIFGGINKSRPNAKDLEAARSFSKSLKKYF